MTALSGAQGQDRGPFRDSEGIERTPNEWGFNSYATAEGAKSGPRGLGRRGQTWYIWRLADGTFDYTSRPNPDLPGHPAELVETVTVVRRGVLEAATAGPAGIPGEER